MASGNIEYGTKYALVKKLEVCNFIIKFYTKLLLSNYWCAFYQLSSFGFNVSHVQCQSLIVYITIISAYSFHKGPLKIY